MAEKAENVFEEATKGMMDAYANQTRAKLQVEMDAPLIIIPISSKDSVTFLANLGTLSLSNQFVREKGRVFDHMKFGLKDLQLSRVQIHEDVERNDIIATRQIIKPLNFELEIKRNVAGSVKRTDPPELQVAGTLYQIQAELSRGDYNAIFAVLK